jgi:catalase
MERDMKNAEKKVTKTPIDVEEVPEQEAAWRNEIAALTVELQEKRKSLQDGEVLRGVHPKSHGCVDADFIVNEDLGGNNRVGLFAQRGKRYKAKIRYSNAAVLRLPDLHEKKNGSRGMAIKVLDVYAGVCLWERPGLSPLDPGARCGRAWRQARSVLLAA